MNSLRCGASLLTLLLALTAPARAAEPDASTRAAARKIATDGVTALQQGNAELASQKLEKAFELLPAPSIALWSARALAKRGLLVEASERYLQAGRLPSSEGNEQAVQAQAQKDAAKELAELSPRVPKIVISLEGAQPSEVSLSLDGKPLPSALIGEEHLVNPGAHQLTATRGADRAEQSFSLAEAQKSPVVLHFEPAAASPAALTPAPEPALAPPPVAASSPGTSHHTLAYVALAVGGAGLVTGAVTGVMAMSKHGDLEDNPACRDGKCLPSARSDVDSLRTLRTVSTIGFIAGGVCAGAGVVLLLTGGSSSQKGESVPRSLALGFAPGSVSMTGTF